MTDDPLVLLETLYDRVGVDVTDIRCDSWCASNIVERETSDEGVSLEEEGEGLADTAWV